ncbi:hypothetical protein D9M73_154370 [compost metagenome]
MAQPAELAGEVAPAPFLLQLPAVVVAPTGPAGKTRAVLRQPVLELRPDFIERGGMIDMVLGDMREFAAERGQHRSTLRPHEALEVIQLAAVGLGDQGGADLDDLHFLDRPAASLGGGFQVDYQPVGHRCCPRFAKQYGRAFRARQTAVLGSPADFSGSCGHGKSRILRSWRDGLSHGGASARQGASGVRLQPHRRACRAVGGAARRQLRADAAGSGAGGGVRDVLRGQRR